MASVMGCNVAIRPADVKQRVMLYAACAVEDLSAFRSVSRVPHICISVLRKFSIECMVMIAYCKYSHHGTAGEELEN